MLACVTCVASRQIQARVRQQPKDVQLDVGHCADGFALNVGEGVLVKEAEIEDRA